jgi:hypothetical protein
MSTAGAGPAAAPTHAAWVALTARATDAVIAASRAVVAATAAAERVVAAVVREVVVTPGAAAAGAASRAVNATRATSGQASRGLTPARTPLRILITMRATARMHASTGAPLDMSATPTGCCARLGAYGVS